MLWVLFGWGIGVLAHGLGASARTSRAIADWEERKTSSHARGALGLIAKFVTVWRAGRISRFETLRYCGGTTFITNDDGFSLGPNGPGTLLLTGFRLFR